MENKCQLSNCFENTQLSKRSLNVKTDMRSTSNVSKLVRLATTAAEQSADACKQVVDFSPRQDGNI